MSGSIAYDFIMNYEGTFKEVILENHLDNLHVSFVAKNKRRDFGGCGCNIAYNLRLLGDYQIILYGVAGKDFEKYHDWLLKNKITTDYIGINPDDFTATAYLLTDKHENQITMFSPGAMTAIKHQKRLSESLFKQMQFGILSPDVCKRSFELGKTFVKNKIPFIFDPGQMAHEFKDDELEFLMERADIIIANSYEVSILAKRLLIDREKMLQKYNAFIETLGENGSNIHVKGEKHHIHATNPVKIVDPTGCGDAFRGGFLSGYFRNFDLIQCAKIGSVLATYAMEHSGTQSHKFTLQEFSRRYKKTYKENLNF